jgi:hypothetical protein
MYMWSALIWYDQRHLLMRIYDSDLDSDTRNINLQCDLIWSDLIWSDLELIQSDLTYSLQSILFSL